MITVKNISKSYGIKRVLNELCCNFPQGCVTAIIGENGSGKSTLLSILGKFIDANDGCFEIDSFDHRNMKREDFSKIVATLRQKNSINVKIKVEEFVKLGRYPHSKSKLNDSDMIIVAEALEIMECSHLSHRYLDTLSGGQLQRVLIAAILAQDTKIILLDEPLNNLDMRHAHKLMETIEKYAKKYNRTILVIMHDINMVYRYADYALALKHGDVVHSGNVNDFKDPQILESIYGLEFNVINVGNISHAVVIGEKI